MFKAIVTTFFIQMSFFLIKCAPFLLKSKLKGILTIMIIKTKALEISKNHFETHLNIFVSNVLLTIKIMNFENVFLIKVIHFCVI
jgi:hypothetical protein